MVRPVVVSDKNGPYIFAFTARLRLRCTIAFEAKVSNLFGFFLGDFDHVRKHVVFVHGLRGDAKATWTASNNSREFWPTWLQVEMPDVAVWSVGYDAGWTEWWGPQAMHLPDRADNILARLLAQPELRYGEIILVTHSHGGLVAKQLIRAADRSALGNAAKADFLSRIRRVGFLATPHQGADLASLAQLGRILLRPSPASKSMVRNDPTLRELNLWFRNYARDHQIQTLTLTETKTTWRTLLIVKPDSADAGLLQDPIPVDADHSSITKPNGTSSEIYIHVRDFVSRPVSGKHQSTQIVEAIDRQTDRVDQLSTKAEALPDQVVERIAQKRLWDASVTFELADTQVRERLKILLRGRFFKCDPGNVFEFGESIRTGILASSSKSVKSDALAWCARICARSNTDWASTVLDEAIALGRSELTSIAHAMIVAERGDTAEALNLLSAIGTDQSRSAAFNIVMRHKGPRPAIDWLREAGLEIGDLDPDGKLFLLQSCMDAGLWLDALQYAESLSAMDFEASPALLLHSAWVHLAQVVPDELRGVALHSVPFEARSFPLAADEVALRHRRKARELFGATETAAKTLGISRTADGASDYVVWLGLRDSETRSEALLELERSLRDPLSSLRRLPLGFQFGITLDMQSAEQEIDRQTALTGGRSPEAAYARFALALTKPTPQAIAAYIEGHRAQLELLDRKVIGEIEIEVLAKSGQYEAANTRLQKLIDIGLMPSDVARLETKISETRLADPTNQRRTRYEETKSLADLNALMSALEDNSQWEQLVPYAHTQFDCTRDLADGQRYAKALYKANRLDELIAFCTQQAPLIAQSRFLRRLHCWGLFEIGDVVAARSAIQPLREEQDDAELRQLSVQIFVASGDWEALAKYVESEWEARDLRTAEELLYAAQLSTLIESARLKDLITAAAVKGSNQPEVLVGCYSVAAEAGWEDKAEVGGWISAAIALSGEDGPVQQVGLSKILEWRSEWSQRVDETWQQVVEGKLPLFMAAHFFNRSFARTFLLPAIRNPDEADARKRAQIYAFSAAREISEYSTDIQTLAIDPSAWLTAELLSLTDKILQEFDKIIIPHSTLGWLADEKRKLYYHQPSRVADAREMQQLLANKALLRFERTQLPSISLSAEVGEDLASLITEACLFPEGSAKRLVVRPGPVYRVHSLMEEEASLSDFEPNLCSCMDVVEKLVAKAQLTAVQERNARAYLTLQERPWPTPNPIPDGATLYLDDLAVSYLQHLGLLSKLRPAGLTGIVGGHQLLETEALLDFEASSGRAIQLLDDLRRRLREGINSGKIRLGKLPRVTDKRVGREISSHPTLHVFDLANVANAVVIDDRSLNSISNIAVTTGSRPVLTTLDLLRMLHAREVITQAERYDRLTDLRRYGMAFVPIEEEQLRQLVLSSEVVDGAVRENAELKAMRENCLLTATSDALQLPQEIRWCTGLFQTILNVLKDCWLLDSDDARAAARSDWLLSLMDMRRWSHRFVNSVDPNAIYVDQAMALLRLFALEDLSIKRRYFSWLESEYFDIMAYEEPKLFEEILSRTLHLIESAIIGLNQKGKGHD